jgi:hypothetical protein
VQRRAGEALQFRVIYLDQSGTTFGFCHAQFLLEGRGKPDLARGADVVTAACPHTVSMPMIQGYLCHGRQPDRSIVCQP